MGKGFDDLRKENRCEIILSVTENMNLLGKCSGLSGSIGCPFEIGGYSKFSHQVQLWRRDEVSGLLG